MIVYYRGNRVSLARVIGERCKSMAIVGGPICISIINMKGGVGKTTVAALLARWLTSMSPFTKIYGSSGIYTDTLAIDLDPQANLSQALMGERRYRDFLDTRSPSIVEVFKGYQPPSHLNPSPRPLSVSSVVHSIGGQSSLADSSLELIPSRFDFSDNLIDSIKPDPRILARLIAENFQDKDIVLIDCAPTESIFTQAAYHASRFILVPVRPEYFATIGFPLLNNSLNEFKSKNPSHEIEVFGIVINNGFYDGGNDGGPEKERSMVEIIEEANKNDWFIFQKQIPHSRSFPKMMRGDFSYMREAHREFDEFADRFWEDLLGVADPEFIE